jgi:hypothetical protein
MTVRGESGFCHARRRQLYRVGGTDGQIARHSAMDCRVELGQSPLRGMDGIGASDELAYRETLARRLNDHDPLQ